LVPAFQGQRAVGQRFGPDVLMRSGLKIPLETPRAPRCRNLMVIKGGRGWQAAITLGDRNAYMKLH